MQKHIKTKGGCRSHHVFHKTRDYLRGDLNCITNLNNEKIDGFLTNHETLNMKNIPNPAHTKVIVEWLQTGALIDSYRILYPFVKTFSHTPFNKQADDKSRIDLFLSFMVYDIQFLKYK